MELNLNNGLENQLRKTIVLLDFFNKIIAYLTATFGGNFLYLIVALTSAFSIMYFILIGYAVTRMDKRYFLRNRNIGAQKPNDDPKNSTPTTITKKYLIITSQIIKIPVGACLVLSGIVMLVIPGQGLLTIVIGLSLLPFPYKSRIERNLISRKSVRASLNWIRIKAKKEPFIFD